MLRPEIRPPFARQAGADGVSEQDILIYETDGFTQVDKWELSKPQEEGMARLQAGSTDNVGGIVTAIGLGTLASLGASATWLVLAALLSLVGTGMGIAGSPRQTAAMEAVGPDRVGMAAGTYYTGRYLGGVVGASVAGAVLGQAVTGDAVSAVFAILAVTGLLVTVASVGLPGRPRKAT